MPTPTRRYATSSSPSGAIYAACVAIPVGMAAVAAWITHVIVCIKTASWVLLLFGCIVAPIGVIHGVGVWFGVF